jgi:signal-transduction protein with cAMP-binding, CBS, and nucleotidyltransferase domain
MLASPIWQYVKALLRPSVLCLLTVACLLFTYTALCAVWGRCYELSGQKMQQWNVTEAHTQRCDNAAELPACTCSLSTTMADMVNLVATGHHRRLWVVDDAKKPIGVISLTDLINAVIDRMGAVKVIGD